jgi:hypothetical protein
MSQNALQFEEFLKANSITLEKTVNDDLTTFLIREQIGAPVPTTIGVLCNSHDGLVTVVAYRFLQVTTHAKRQQVLELVNDLNVQYTFIKYNMKDDFVTAHISVPFMDNFNPRLLSDLIMSLINALKQDYPRFVDLLQSQG